MKQLERILFLQGNHCFFCHQPIPNGEASVEHLVATSNGGVNDDDNCVVCCKAVNAALGNLSIKEKLQVVVNQRTGFACPNIRSAEVIAVTDVPECTRIELVIADLLRRGAALPRKVRTRKNTINSLFQRKLSDEGLVRVVADLELLGYISIQGVQVDYVLTKQTA